MSSGRSSVCLILLFISSVCFADHIHLNCQAYCPGEDVTASCSGFDYDDEIVWSIYDASAQLVGNVSFNSSNELGTTQYLTAGGVNFSFAKTSNSNSVTNFTATPEINNYWLECSVYDDPNNVSVSNNCSIIVNSTLSIPEGLEFFSNSIQDTSVAVNWTDVPDMCATGYVVLVYANGSIVVNTTTQDNSYIIRENIIDVEYCIAVATRRSDDAIGTPTNPICITLATPLPVVFNTPTYTLNQMDIATGLRISWTETPSSRPETIWYYVAIDRSYPSVSSGSGSGSGNDQMTNDFFSFRNRSNVTSINLQDSRLGTTYNVRVIAENILGNGTASYLSFTITRPTPTPSTSILVPSSTITTLPSTTPTSGTTDTTTPGLETWEIAVIAVGSGIGLAVIVAIVIFLICCCCCCISRMNKGPEEHELKGTHL